MRDHHPISSTRVDYTLDAQVFEGYVAQPETLREKRPGVVLMHDWSGLNQGIRAVADRVAGLGYVCFALDVYGKGVRGNETGDNSHLMNPMLADRALLRRRLLRGLQAATEQPLIDASRVAAIGYCFGGLCALDLARAAPPELRAAVSFHGVLNPPDLGEQRRIKASVLLLHGWNDPFAPPSDVLAIAAELTNASADWQLHAYGHARHAFTFAGANMPERGIVYDEAADRRSWLAMQHFLREVFDSPQ